MPTKRIVLRRKLEEPKRKPYRVTLPENTELSLRDLYVFPRAYEQCYSFVYCFDTTLEARDSERIDEAIASYPWKGGYSYVNIYSVLYSQIPSKSRPKIQSIHKASPGWIDLVLNLEAAVTLAKSIATIAGSMALTAAAYTKAMKLIAQISANRQAARLREMQLTQQQIKAVRGCCDELAKAMGFKSLNELHQRTGNPEVSLKLMGAHYRRMKILLNFSQKQKAILPTEIDG